MSFFDREAKTHEQIRSWGQRTEPTVTNTGSEEEREPVGGKIAVLKVGPWFFLWIAPLYESLLLWALHFSAKKQAGLDEFEIIYKL